MEYTEDGSERQHVPSQVPENADASGSIPIHESELLNKAETAIASDPYDTGFIWQIVVDR